MFFLSIINSNRYSDQSERSVTQLPENSKCLVFGQAVFQASPLVPANTACYAGHDLCTPDSPKDKSFSQLCDKLRDHYKPKRLEVAERYRFHRCVQEENESVSAYSARLRRYASTCNFGEFLNRSLRDQFICGIRNSATRKKLLNEDRTFQDAL